MLLSIIIESERYWQIVQLHHSKNHANQENTYSPRGSELSGLYWKSPMDSFWPILFYQSKLMNNCGSQGDSQKFKIEELLS